MTVFGNQSAFFFCPAVPGNCKNGAWLIFSEADFLTQYKVSIGNFKSVLQFSVTIINGKWMRNFSIGRWRGFVLRKWIPGVEFFLTNLTHLICLDAIVLLNNPVPCGIMLENTFPRRQVEKPSRKEIMNISPPNPNPSGGPPVQLVWQCPPPISQVQPIPFTSRGYPAADAVPRGGLASKQPTYEYHPGYTRDPYWEGPGGQQRAQAGYADDSRYAQSQYDAVGHDDYYEDYAYPHRQAQFCPPPPRHSMISFL